MELTAPGWDDYELIDSGNELKLERIGGVVVSRQTAQAIWRPALSESEWNALLHASHYRHDQGPGEWRFHRPVPDAWGIALDRLRFEIRLTQFGHTGLFAEQQAQWGWIGDRVAARPGTRVLNLFAYTGGSTLAAAARGARVTHVDAVKGVVSWARGNATRSGLSDAGIRWIVDDAPKYLQRELRRGSRYDAVVLDPPTFGRGPDGSIWKIERDLVAMLDVVQDLLSDQPLFVLLSAHTPGLTAAVLRNVMLPFVVRRGGALEAGDMVQVGSRSPWALPAGSYCRWTIT